MKKITDIVPVIAQELSPIVKQAMEIEIKVSEDLPPAVELLSRLNLVNDRIVAEREKVTAPLNQALKAERARWKPMELQNTQAIEMIREKMSKYQTKQMQLQKDKEAKIAQKLTDGKITLDKAIEQIEKVKTPDKEIATTAGLVQFRESQILEITDESLIPREYLMVDEKKLLADLKNGKNVEGAKLTIIQCPINYR